MHAHIYLEPIPVEGLMSHDINHDSRIYQYRGIWWREVNPFFCIPAWHLASFHAHEVAPPVLKSLIGYLHLVPKNSYNNCWYYIICLDRLEDYGIENLRRQTRQEIRRGLNHLDIRRITSLSHLLTDGYQVYLSWFKRIINIKGPKYNNFKKFHSLITNEISFDRKLFLGAYFGDKLIAFIIACVIDNTAYIEKCYSQTDYLKYHPTQTLLYSFISICKYNPSISKISLGPASFERPSLNKFKIRQGFDVKAFPAFIKINPTAGKLMKFFSRDKYYHFLRYLKYLKFE